MHHNGSFWMEFRWVLFISSKLNYYFSDWVTIFDSFDICHIPSSSHPDTEEPCFHREERCTGQFGPNTTITFQERFNYPSKYPKIDDFETTRKLKVGARRNIFLQTLLDTRASYISNFSCSKLILKDSKGKIIRPRLPLQVSLQQAARPFHYSWALPITAGLAASRLLDLSLREFNI